MHLTWREDDWIRAPHAAGVNVEARAVATYADCGGVARKPTHMRAFNKANEVILARPKKTDSLAPGEALDVVALASFISARGHHARHFDSVDEILATLLSEAKAGDVLLVMSNGAFGGLVPKLKAGLESRQ